MSDLEAARKQWLAERSSYEGFGLIVSEQLKLAVKELGIWCEITSRAKEMDSLVRKLIKKPEHTYDTLGDKTGVRVIVRYLDEVPAVVELADVLFDCGEPEYTVNRLDENKVGYLSAHVDVKLLAPDPSAGEYPPEKYCAELQIRTLAQHLWSEMSHDTFYKSDETLAPLPKDPKRRIHLLAGLVELADVGFNRINNELPQNPELQLLRAMERHYFKLTARKPDPELSIRVIAVLYPLYATDVSVVVEQIDHFFAKHRHVLEAIYSDETVNPTDHSAFLFQPEVLMIYERLTEDDLATRRAWNQHFPEGELELIANRFGFSFN